MGLSEVLYPVEGDNPAFHSSANSRVKTAAQ